MKLRILLMMLASVALIGLASCGGDDDSSDETSAGETATTGTAADETAKEEGDGGGSAIEINADPDGALAYEESSVTAAAGEVTIDFFNDSGVGHDVRIEDSGGEDLGGTEVISTGEAEATVDLESGEYTFYCSVPGHREGGMEGTLTAE